MKRLFAVMLAAFLLMPVAAQGILVNETCLNQSHLLVTFEYNLEVDDTTTEYKYNQIHECTNGCVDDTCNAMDASVDISSMWVTFAAGLVFLVIGTALGIPFGKFVGKEEITQGWDTTLVVRYIFFFIGFFLVYLSLGMSRRVSSIYGGDANIVDAAGTATMVMRITFTLFFIVMFVETLFYIIKYYQQSSYTKRWEHRKE